MATSNFREQYYRSLRKHVGLKVEPNLSTPLESLLKDVDVIGLFHLNTFTFIFCHKFIYL